MNFNAEEIAEFKNEAIDLLDSAERELLGLESDGNVRAHYDCTFRVFHSLKGGAGMLGFEDLKNHMHSVESLFSGLKSVKSVSKPEITFYLKCVDAARQILDGKKLQFNYNWKDLKEVVEVKPTRALSPNAPLIYAIDDEPDLLSVISEILTDANLRCETFSDPLLGIEAVRKHPPAALLVDMKMPGMTGLEVFAEVKKIEPDLPVLFVSGCLDKQILLQSIQAGIFSAVEKPFNSKTLLTQVLTAARFRETSKLLNRSVNLLIYQYSDLDKFLELHGKEDIQKTIRHEMEQIIEHKKNLREFFK